MNIKIFVYPMIWNIVHMISIYGAAIFVPQQSSVPLSLQINMENSSMNILKQFPLFKNLNFLDAKCVFNTASHHSCECKP